MRPVNNRIIVSVNMKQKDTMRLGNIEVMMALPFEVNHREKSPVIAKVEEGNKLLKPGSIIICHHNHFYPPSPYFLYESYFSIPVNHTIFARMGNDGSLMPVYGNILGEKIDIETTLPLPPEQRQQYKDRIRVVNGIGTEYQQGQLLFTKPSAPYDIVYNFNGEVKRVTKIWEKMVVGFVK